MLQQGLIHRACTTFSNTVCAATSTQQCRKSVIDPARLYRYAQSLFHPPLPQLAMHLHTIPQTNFTALSSNHSPSSFGSSCSASLKYLRSSLRRCSIRCPRVGTSSYWNFCILRRANGSFICRCFLGLALAEAVACRFLLAAGTGQAGTCAEELLARALVKQAEVREVEARGSDMLVLWSGLSCVTVNKDEEVSRSCFPTAVI